MARLASLDGLAQAPLIGQYHAEIIPGLGKPRVDAHRVAVVVFGLGPQVHSSQHVGQVVVGVRILEVDGKGLAKRGACLVGLARDVQQAAEIKMGPRIAGRAVCDLMKGGFGLGKSSQLVQRATPIVVGRGVLRIRLDRLAVDTLGFGPPACLFATGGMDQSVGKVVHAGSSRFSRTCIQTSNLAAGRKRLKFLTARGLAIELLQKGILGRCPGCAPRRLHATLLRR